MKLVNYVISHHMYITHSLNSHIFIYIYIYLFKAQILGIV